MCAAANEHEEQDLTNLHDEAGVDLSQIDIMLAMTPKQRLDTLFETARSFARLLPDDDAHLTP